MHGLPVETIRHVPTNNFHSCYTDNVKINDFSMIEEDFNQHGEPHLLYRHTKSVLKC